MTPNQAQELQDLILGRTAGRPPLNEDDRKRLAEVVERNIDAPARKAHPYVKISSNGLPHATNVLAVGVNGNTIPIEVESITFEMGCDGGRVVLRLPSSGTEVDLNLETNEAAINAIAKTFYVPDRKLLPVDDFDDAITPALPPTPDADASRWSSTTRTDTGVDRASFLRAAETLSSENELIEQVKQCVSEVARASEPRVASDAELVSFKRKPEETVHVPSVREPARGPHVHTYINGVCPGCGRRE